MTTRSRPIHVTIPADLHRAVRIKAAETDTTVSAIIAEALTVHLQADRTTPEPPVVRSADPIDPAPQPRGGPPEPGASETPGTPNPLSIVDDVTAGIWGDGLQYLIEHGAGKESTVRAFLGRLIKQYGKQALNDALTDVMAQDPAEPKAYLCKILKQPGHTDGAGKPKSAARNWPVPSKRPPHYEEIAGISRKQDLIDWSRDVFAYYDHRCKQDPMYGCSEEYREGRHDIDRARMWLHPNETEGRAEPLNGIERGHG